MHKEPGPAAEETRPAQVRRARAADLPRLLQLLGWLRGEEAGPRPPTAAEEAAFAQLEEDRRCDLLVLEREGQVLATVQLSLLPSLSGGGRPRAYLDALVVDPACRGQGLGAALVLHCLALCRERGARRLSLLTNRERTEAHRFYQRQGFARSHLGYVMVLG
jgi:ribosomal protein S18 acetylase RimI-like enzyme